MLLKELSPGTKGTIVGYDKKAPEYRRRLLMLGATPVSYTHLTLPTNSRV